tara:strand:+ start:138 stop:425 length:288 start_codon:yes stop_codon:yes gene_type:complete
MGLKVGPFKLRTRHIRHLAREVSDQQQKDRERAGEEAALTASKSAKDAGTSTEEAASIVEEARDSAVEEARKQQSMVWLLLIGLGMLYLMQQGSP